MSDDTARSDTRAADRCADDVGQALLHAAHQVLADEGPFGLTVRRVAQVAGVSTMNVYSRFGGKDGLIEQLFIDGFVRLGEHMKSVPPTDDPVADLRRCRGRYRDFALANRTYYVVMFDSVIPDWRPSPVGEEVAYSALGGMAAAVQRAIDAGQLAVTDADGGGDQPVGDVARVDQLGTAPPRRRPIRLAGHLRRDAGAPADRFPKRPDRCRLRSHRVPEPPPIRSSS